MSVWQVKGFFRAAGFWKSFETLTRINGGVLSLAPSLNPTPTTITRSLCMCSRHTSSSQRPALHSGAGVASAPSAPLGILSPKVSCVVITRGKVKKIARKPYNQKQDAGSDTEDEVEGDDMALESGTDFREIRARVPSLRLDAILKAGLNMSRNKVESAFYASTIRINGKKLLKKSHQCHEGDEIDVVRTVSSQNPNNLQVSRVVVVALGNTDQEDDKVTVKLRRYPNLLVERYQDYKVEGEEE